MIFVLGSESKYTHVEIEKRWQYINFEFKKRNIAVISYGADGAEPFMKAMLTSTSLFTVSNESNVPSWSCFMMQQLTPHCLYVQDPVHLLAKLRTRLITPSNILSIGSTVACRGHLMEVLKRFSKGKTWF